LIALTAALALTVAAIAASRTPSRDGFQRGFVVLGWKSDSYVRPTADAALKRMAADGASHVAIFTQWVLPDSASSDLAPDPARTPSDASILHAMSLARGLGMNVTLKPQIGVGSLGWIGTARPSDPAEFWKRYSAMLLHYAGLAQRGGASMLVIGTEMATMSGDTRRWLELIGEVRKRFTGALTYAANYDEYQRVGFWGALDYIGIDAYFPLANAAHPSPTGAQLAAAWREHLTAIGRFSGKTGKRVLFTELGYRAIATTAVRPNDWKTAGTTDTRAQADAYQAFYDAVAKQPWMAGVYWWAVNPDGAPPQDYDPIGKPAEAVVARENARAMLTR